VLAADRVRADAMVVVDAQGLDTDLTGSRVRIGGALLPALCEDRLRVAPSHELFEPLGAGSGASIRIAGADGAAGVLCVAAADPARRFERRDRELLAVIAQLLGAALEDVRMGAHLGEKVRACRHELSRLADAPRRGTAGPRLDLCTLSGRVGAALGLDRPGLMELELAARLAQLGCPAAAERSIDLMPGFEAAALVLRLAGERWDGCGRPYGLERERIPVASRVLAACRAAVRDGGLRRVRAASGGAFDPSVVGALRLASGVSGDACGGDAVAYAGGAPPGRAPPRCAWPSGAQAP
jgi:hypothetical protein